MENIMMLILGVFISVMGIVNIKGNISTIHSYNRRKVKEEDAAKDTTTSSAEENDPLERRHEVLTDELIPTKEEAKKRKYEENLSK